METQAFLMIAMPVLMGLIAIGALLAIKIARRRQAPAGGNVATAVPTRPMSAEHAATLRRRYDAVAGLILAGLAVLGLWIAAV